MVESDEEYSAAFSRSRGQGWAARPDRSGTMPPSRDATRHSTPPRSRVTTPPKIGDIFTPRAFAVASAAPGHIRRPPPHLPSAGTDPASGVGAEAARDRPQMPTRSNREPQRPTRRPPQRPQRPQRPAPQAPQRDDTTDPADACDNAARAQVAPPPPPVENLDTDVNSSPPPIHDGSEPTEPGTQTGSRSAADADAVAAPAPQQNDGQDYGDVHDSYAEWYAYGI
eukprot:COSAG06_NODE_614_length_13779_cov_89.527412_2_plen_225_part_00